MKQLIIARKDLQMSPGKLAAQVSHASMAFIANWIRQGSKAQTIGGENYIETLYIPKDIYDGWFMGAFTKVVCEAKNRNQLMKVVDKAKELGLVQGRDFFLIRDNCLTELEPEEEYPDLNGELHGCTLTCIGFKPLEDEIAQQLSKKYQLYK